MVMRTTLAILHHNFNIEAEDRGYRQVERVTHKYSKAKGRVVDVCRKTLVAIAWKSHCNDLIASALRVSSLDADQSDDRDPYAMHENAGIFEVEEPEWSSESSSDDEDE